MTYHVTGSRRGALGADAVTTIGGGASKSTVGDLQEELNRFADPLTPAEIRFQTVLSSGVMDLDTIGRAAKIMLLRAATPGGEAIAGDAGRLLAQLPTAAAKTWMVTNLDYVTGIVRGYADINKLPSARSTVTLPILGKVPVGIALGAVVVAGLLLFGRRKGRR